MKLRLFSLATTFVVLVFSTAALGQSANARLPHQAVHDSPASTPQILYHGGPVMVQNNHIYVIYYGSFSPTTTDVIDTFLENLGGSGAYGVNSTYYNGQGQYITNAPNSLVYARTSDSYYDAYSLGHTMKGKSIANEVQSVLQNGHLLPDNNGIYLLITSPDVTVPSNYCGYHTYSTTMIPGYIIKYAFSPDPAPPTYNYCSGNISTFGDTTSPNEDVGADSVADTLIHEISETVTDPNISAWYTKNGYENGDLCNFVYGQTFLAPNGSHANHVFGPRNYLVQTIWVNTGAGSCALSYP
ncbi:MAG: hypothetical protein ACR2IF_18930 [Terriglobales bacterium]